MNGNIVATLPLFQVWWWGCGPCPRPPPITLPLHHRPVAEARHVTLHPWALVGRGVVVRLILVAPRLQLEEGVGGGGGAAQPLRRQRLWWVGGGGLVGT